MKADVKDFIGVYEDAFTAEWCQSLVNEFEYLHSQGFSRNRQEYDSSKQTEKDDNSFSSPDVFQTNGTGEVESSLAAFGNKVGAQFNNVLWDKCYADYVGHYPALKQSGKHINWLNKVNRTEVGQGYHIWHFEQASREQATRLMAYILYLNDVDEGGETEFLHQTRRIKPEAGTLVLFPASYTHLHRGNTPLSNTKYILTGWIEF
jgi:hypothetical protein